MTRIDPARLSAILHDAPVWARTALASADPRQRERAADAIAATIIERLDRDAR